MALSCEVYHDVRMLLLEKLVNSVTVCDAFLYKAEVRFVHDRCKSGKVSGIGQAVQAYDTVIRMSLHHMKNKLLPINPAPPVTMIVIKNLLYNK